MDLNKIKKIHFVGIGGSGMLPLACIALQKGFSVSGSDIQKSLNTEKLCSLGAEICMNHQPKNIGNSELVVYSNAVKKTNPEVNEAIKNGIKVISRSKFLGELTKDYKKLIAISGSHGKTTTSSIITCILVDAGFDPTAIIGANFKKIGGSSQLGKSDIVVCEACEYMDSFLDLEPNLGIILNVDDDHLDYFKNLNGVISSFNKFADKCKNLLISADDENTIAATKDSKANKIFYSLSSKAQWFADNIRINSCGYAKFDVLNCGEKIFEINLKIPGRHNIYNALAAIVACDFLGVRKELIKSSLESFTGADRRFELVGKIQGITVIDDFAHHPMEIEATLKTAVNLGFKRVWAIFQPHTFSRTFLLMDNFARALSIADRVILTDILPVREKNIYGIKSEDLSNKIRNSLCLGSFENVSKFMLENTKLGDLILTMGGGDIYKCAHMIFEGLKNAKLQKV
ncbi:MAG: UDP-N-acetylmuramate--L-alanine ligase [Oscillospiraceae bacterium]|nr:UDP-N-acetylmuramate--L-alanine ligase [Oscillospiraceae bacterium]